MNTMNAAIMKIAEQIVSRSQALLMMDKYLNPVIFEVMGNTITPMENIKLKTETDKINISKVLHEMSTRSEAIIIILDAWVKHVSKEKVKLNPNLMEETEPTPALIFTVYTKEGTHTRVIVHTDGGRPIIDKGWETITNDGGYLHNPYLKPDESEIIELF